MKKRVIDGVTFLTPETKEEVEELQKKVKEGKISSKNTFADWRPKKNKKED